MCNVVVEYNDSYVYEESKRGTESDGGMARGERAGESGREREREAPSMGCCNHSNLGWAAQANPSEGEEFVKRIPSHTVPQIPPINNSPEFVGRILDKLQILWDGQPTNSG